MLFFYKHKSHTLLTESTIFLKYLYCTFFVAVLICFNNNTYAQHEAYPPGFSQVLVADGLSYPTAIAFAPDGRIFVTEQDGKVRIIKNGILLPTPFVVVNAYLLGESGLTGIAIDPDFDINQYIYLYYTIPSVPKRNRIVRYKAEGDVANVSSENVILELDPLNYANQHNGGSMSFGPDGKLYVGVGESRIPENAQNLDTHLGKILRINPDGSVPADNPFQTGSEQRKRIWAYGLRNPFSLSIQPETGRLFVNDVGEGGWEEINDVTEGGINFGWPYTEGFTEDSTSIYRNPIFAYDHSNARCAITGGAFFNPTTTTYPHEYIGNYFFQDYCTSIIYRMNLTNSAVGSTAFAQNLPGQPVGLTTGLDGNIYFLSRHFNSIYKIIYTSNSTPEITRQPQNTVISQGRPAKFSVSTTGASPLSFQWQKNGVDIEGAISAVYTIPVTALADSGKYCVLISNGYGSVTSVTASLSVTIPNGLPKVTINSPANHSIYNGGDIISFDGTAVDPEDGELSADSFSWTLEFHHDTHMHDGPPITVGAKSGNFEIPRVGETASNVFYRLILTVTDSQGGVGADTVDIDPHIVQVTISSNRAGLQANLNGPPVQTPYTKSFVSGIEMSLSAPKSQTINGVTYLFKNWLKGPDSSGYFIVPNTTTTYKAIYAVERCVPPANLSSINITDNSAKLIWQSNGVVEGTRFEVRWRTTDSTADPATWNVINNIDGASGSGAVSVTGLMSGSSYEWQIRTLCSDLDNSPFSTSVLFTALGTCNTLKTGQWNDPTIWACGRVPTNSDIAYLNHSVTIPANYTAKVGGVVYKAPVKLIYDSKAYLHLRK